MMWNTSKSQTVLCIVLLILIASACASQTPEEQIAEMRGQYTVELNSFTILDQQSQEAPPEEAEGAGAVAAEAAAVASEAAVAAETGEEAEEGNIDEEVTSGPQPRNVLFDLVVYFRGKKALDGITVDITHADAMQQEKAVYQQYVETAGMVNGDTRQVDFMLEGLEIEEGDAFSVTLAAGIPADLSQYREFSEPAP